MHGVGAVPWTSTMYNSVCGSSALSRTGVPSIGIDLVAGLKTVALDPWKRTARSPAQILLTERSGLETSLKRCASQDDAGSSGMLRLSLATEAMILSSAT